MRRHTLTARGFLLCDGFVLWVAETLLRSNRSALTTDSASGMATAKPFNADIGHFYIKRGK